MSDPTPPAVSVAMRAAMACDIADILLNGGAISPAAFARYLGRAAGPIASEIARLTGERDAMLTRIGKEVFDRLAAEAETARLRAALEFYADPLVYRMNGACDPNSSQFTGNSTARAALSSQEKTDA